jgi:hypothetical protein
MEANHTTPVCRLNSGLGYVNLIGWIVLPIIDWMSAYRCDWLLPDVFAVMCLRAPQFTPTALATL